MEKNKCERSFDAVYKEISRRRGVQGGGDLDSGDLKEIVAAAGVTMPEWYGALSHAKVKTPNMYEMFYRAFGKKPPPPRKSPTKRVSQQHQEEVEEPAAVDPPEEAPSPSDVLASILGWLDQVDRDARRRIIRAVETYYHEESAA